MADFKIIKKMVTAHNNNIAAYSNHHGRKNHEGGYVYLLAGTHGDEPESTYVLNKLIQERFFNLLPYKIIFILEVNPDGLKANTRVNANGVDLNRNFPTPGWVSTYQKERYFPGQQPNSEIETNFLIELFQEYPPYFIMSFHSWKPILNYNEDSRSKELAELISHYNQYPITPDIGYTTPGSLGEYAASILKCSLITYELPIASDVNSLLAMENIWVENKAALQAALEFLTTSC